MFKGIGQESDDIWIHISTYTKRQLRYEPDIINGILENFRAYGKFGDSIYHHWAIPVSWLGFIDTDASLMAPGFYARFGNPDGSLCPLILTRHSRQRRHAQKVADAAVGLRCIILHGSHGGVRMIYVSPSL